MLALTIATLNSNGDPQYRRGWKLCSWLFTMTLWWEIIITIVYWSFFHGKFKGNKDVVTAAEQILLEIKNITDHLVPIVCLIGDWILNSISCEPRQFWPNLIPISLYLIVNFIVVKGTGQILYPGLTWDSLETLWIALIGFLILPIIWFVMCWVTNKKLQSLNHPKPN